MMRTQIPSAPNGACCRTRRIAVQCRVIMYADNGHLLFCRGSQASQQRVKAARIDARVGQVGDTDGMIFDAEGHCGGSQLIQRGTARQFHRRWPAGRGTLRTCQSHHLARPCLTKFHPARLGLIVHYAHRHDAHHDMAAEHGAAAYGWRTGADRFPPGWRRWCRFEADRTDEWSLNLKCHFLRYAVRAVSLNRT